MAGGLGEYFGVDATALRVGFVIVSILFLGGFGGPVLYVLAWIFMPEEGSPTTSAVAAPVFRGRPWHDWDRSARSWAVVLAALVLAVMWSFGIWPWWHWRALPLWLAGTGIAIWAVTRHRRGYWSSPPGAPGTPGTPGAPGSPGWPGGQPGYGSGPGAGPGNSPPPGDAGPYPGYNPYAPGAEAAPGAAAPGAAATGAAAAGAPDGTATVPDGAGGVGPAAPSGLADPAAQEAADWAAAQAAAQGWAASQLAAAGVPNPGTAVVAPPPARPPSRRVLRAITWLFAICAALFLLAIVSAVGVTLGSGSSLRGGVGHSIYVPARPAEVSSHYRLGMGQLTVDLSKVTFPATGKTVDISLGMGQARVDVPDHTLVKLDAHAALGDVEAFNQSGPDLQLTQWCGAPTGKAGHKLTIHAHVGMGQVRVNCVNPGS